MVASIAETAQPTSDQPTSGITDSHQSAFFIQLYSTLLPCSVFCKYHVFCGSLTLSYCSVSALHGCTGYYASTETESMLCKGGQMGCRCTADQEVYKVW